MKPWYWPVAIRTPCILLNKSNHVITICVGCTRGIFEDILEEATPLFQRDSNDLPPLQKSADVLLHRKQGKRGDFHSIVTGFSYGSRQKAHFLSLDPLHSPLLISFSTCATGIHAYTTVEGEQSHESVGWLSWLTSRIINNCLTTGYPGPGLHPDEEAIDTDLWDLFPQHPCIL